MPEIHVLWGDSDLQAEFYHLKNFEDLLYDAVHLLYFAHDVDPENDVHGYEYTFVRGSMLNAVLLFECGANCCMDALSLASPYAEDLDKLPFLSKYEFFLSRVAPGVAFDRGCTELQAAAELKSARDRYVHPKVKKKGFVPVGEGRLSAEFGRTKVLGVPHDPREWGRSTAVSTLRSVNGFFNLFFLEWCRFAPNTVYEILLGSEAAQVPSRLGVTVDCIGGLDRATKEWQIDFRFIGKTAEG